MFKLKAVIIGVLLVFAGVAGYAGAKALRLGSGAQLRAAMVVGQPFVVRTYEKITRPDGTVHPGSRRTEARAGDGTRYSIYESIPNGLITMEAEYADGRVVRAVPNLGIKTSGRLDAGEMAELLGRRQNPAANCMVNHAGLSLPGSVAGRERAGALNLVRIVTGESGPGKVLHNYGVSPEFGCVLVKFHGEYRDRPGEYSETNRELLSAEAIEPGVEITELCANCAEVGPLERARRQHEFVGVHMSPELTALFAAKDEAYQKRQK